MLPSFLCGEFLLHIPCLSCFLCREFLLHIACWLLFHLGSSTYTSRAVLIFMQGVSLTHPVLALNNIYIYMGSVSYTLAFFLSGEFLLHIPCWLHFYVESFSDTSLAGFIFMRGISLTHPMLTLFLCGEFLLHIPCCLHFYAGTFSYTSPAGFFFLFSFFFFFFLESFSYTSSVHFFFIWGISLTNPVLASFSIWGVSLTHPVLA